MSSTLLKDSLTANLNNGDFLTAQFLERQEKEALRFKLSKENAYDEDYAVEMSTECNSDSEYAAELEHEWLKVNKIFLTFLNYLNFNLLFI